MSRRAAGPAPPAARRRSPPTGAGKPRGAPRTSVQPPPKRRPPSPSVPRAAGSRSNRSVHTSSSSTRSWPASSTTPGRSRRKPVSTPIASSSRWLVGSSSSRQAGRVVIRVASASRVRCPPERVPTLRVGSSPPRPEPLRRLVGATIGVPGIVGHRAVESLGVRRLADLVPEVEGQALHLRDHPAQGQEGAGQHLGDGLCVRERGLLAEQCEVVRAVDRPGHHGTRRERARNRAQQGGLAAAVLADQADPATGSRDQVDAVEHLPGAEPDVEVDETKRGEDERRHQGAFGTEVGDSPGTRRAAGASLVSARRT